MSNFFFNSIFFYQGHYRFCEALFALGEIERAIASNEKAQELCRDSQEGIKDLIQQHSKFKKLMKETAGRGNLFEYIYSGCVCIGRPSINGRPWSTPGPMILLSRLSSPPVCRIRSFLSISHWLLGPPAFCSQWDFMCVPQLLGHVGQED